MDSGDTKTLDHNVLVFGSLLWDNLRAIRQSFIKKIIQCDRVLKPGVYNFSKPCENYSYRMFYGGDESVQLKKHFPLLL